MKRILKAPFLVILMGLTGLAMFVPAGHAVRIGDFWTVRVFFQTGLLVMLLSALIGVAAVNYRARNSARSHLLALMQAFIVLPAIMAFPLTILIPNISYSMLYFEMLSCLTTTGASIFDETARLSEPVHLWRGFVAWIGGFLMLVSAIAILAPLNLGGFEVYSSGATASMPQARNRIKAADVSDRLITFCMRLGPVYLGVTVFLAFLLLVSGERSFVAVMHALATISTSGITSGDALATGFRGELWVFLFLFFAVSRLSFDFENGGPNIRAIIDDHEFRLALVFVGILPALLFVRHWLGAYEVDAQEDSAAAFQALWGAVFTTLSFLTTTGLESASWAAARNWSGLHTTGIILMGLAVMGGGVATTAGGIKLLRVYALYRHGARELEKLSFPSSVGGAGRAARHIRREGAYIAWLFFMLFAISSAAVLIALSVTGLEFEEALAFSVAALSTTGPLAGAVLENGIGYGDLDGWALSILGGAMILGRLETLAIVALFNPDFWR